MTTPELNADSLVFLFGSRFADEWVERKTDPIFGRTPPDARFRVAPADGAVLSEKSLAEAVAYCSLAQLIMRGCVEAEVHVERGWNLEVYDRVYVMSRLPFPEGPIFGVLANVCERSKRPFLTPVRRRYAERGVPVDVVVASMRRFRFLRGDPYQFVCGLVQRDLMQRGFYKRERTHVAGPLLASVWQPDPERALEYEFLVLRLERDLEGFETEDPILAAALRDNVARTMLKMHSDEDYASERLKAEESTAEGTEDAEMPDEESEEKGPR